MTSEHERLVRRRAFDAIPSAYEEGRPPYPAALLNELVELTHAGPGQRILEIGAGTGQLTEPLAETGASVLAMEFGPSLAARLRERMRGRENVEVLCQDFDVWDSEETAFDSVVIASAFHWLDPESRVRRCHDRLRRDGCLAVVDVRWGVRTAESDDLFSKIQACYEQWDPGHDPDYWHPTPEEVPTRADELRTSGLFEPITRRRYRVHRTYSMNEFLKLINTYSKVRSWSERTRDGFLACVESLLRTWFPTGVRQTDLHDLTVGRAGP